MVLPTLFNNISAVQVNTIDLDSTQWIVEDWGIRVYQSIYDADGFLRWDLSDYNTDLGFGSGLYGAQVIVTATFGYPDVPARVRRAAIMLAARYATDDLSSLTPDSRLKLLSVKG